MVFFPMYIVVMKLIGNHSIRSRLQRLVKTESLHHCLLFEGPKGIGKYVHALWLAKIINCTEAQDGDENFPCNRCWSCRMIDRMEHPDIRTIGYDPQKATKIISVRQARELILEIQVHPFRAKKRVVIIEPADAMRVEAANALLKTLEEPPTSTMFILICDFATQLLPTIRSRSQRVRFQPLSKEELQDWIVDQPDAHSSLSVLALSEGTCGGAKAILNQQEEWIQLRNEFLSVVRKGPSDQIAWVASFCSGPKQKWLPTMELLLDIIATVLRDLWLLEAASTVELYHEDIRGSLLRFQRNPIWLSKLFQELMQIHSDLSIHVNGKLLLEAFLASAHGKLVDS